jgi:hypothetical protein
MNTGDGLLLRADSQHRCFLHDRQNQTAMKKRAFSERNSEHGTKENRLSQHKIQAARIFPDLRSGHDDPCLVSADLLSESLL